MFKGYGNRMCFITDYIPMLPGEAFRMITDEAIPGIKPYYMVSDKGRVWQGILNRFKSIYVNNSGYVCLDLATYYGYKKITLHRLVMLTFNPISNPELYEVNHKNGNKLINELWNLEWCTTSENIIHGYNTGLYKSGEDMHNAVISNELAICICQDLQDDILSTAKIAEKYKINESIVKNIKSGKSYKYISKAYTFTDHTKFNLFSDNDINGICQYFQNNPKNIDTTVSDHCRDAMDYIGYDYHNNDRQITKAARNIYNRINYTHISSNYNF